MKPQTNLTKYILDIPYVDLLVAHSSFKILHSQTKPTYFWYLFSYLYHYDWFLFCHWNREARSVIRKYLESKLLDKTTWEAMSEQNLLNKIPSAYRSNVIIKCQMVANRTRIAKIKIKSMSMDWNGSARFGWTLNLYTLVENECAVNSLDCFLEMASAQAHQSVGGCESGCVFAFCDKAI